MAQPEPLAAGDADPPCQRRSVADESLLELGGMTAALALAATLAVTG